MRVTEGLILLCVLVFVWQLVAGYDAYWQFELTPAYLSEAPWTVLTSMFMHGDPTHIFFNMFALFIFGGALERRLGKGNYLLLYLVSGTVGSVGFMLLDSPFSSALGASGAVYGLIGGLALLEPHMVVFLMGIPMPMYVAGFVYAGLELFGLGAADGIAHSAHLLGLFGGLGIAWWFGKKQEPADGWALPAQRGVPLWVAALLGILLALGTGFAFGQYYLADAAVGGVVRCEEEYSEEGGVYGVADCMLDLSREYAGDPAKLGMICGQYAGWAAVTCDSDCYAAAYGACMRGG